MKYDWNISMTTKGKSFHIFFAVIIAQDFSSRIQEFTKIYSAHLQILFFSIEPKNPEKIHVYQESKIFAAPDNLHKLSNNLKSAVNERGLWTFWSGMNMGLSERGTFTAERKTYQMRVSERKKNIVKVYHLLKTNIIEKSVCRAFEWKV